MINSIINPPKKRVIRFWNPIKIGILNYELCKIGNNYYLGIVPMYLPSLYHKINQNWKKIIKLTADESESLFLKLNEGVV